MSTAPVVFPMSFGQQRLWFLDQMRPGSPFYTISLGTRWRTRVELPALQRALNLLAERHEILRTRIVTVDEQPCQLVVPTAEVPLEFVDIGELAPDARERELQLLANRFSRRPFELEGEAPIRTMIVRLDDENWGFLLAMHHIASDAWSLGVLFSELAIAYEAELRGQRAALEPLPLQYGDYAVWQRRRLRGPALERELEFWRGQLAGLPALELPLDFRRPQVLDYRGESLEFHIEPATAQPLQALARQRGATPFMVTLTAFAAVLARWSSQDDFAVGTSVAGRPAVELEGLIGFFINSLVLRLSGLGELDFDGALAHVRETCLAAFGHQDLPFDRIVEELQPARDPSRNPLFQVTFQYLDIPAVELAGRGQSNARDQLAAHRGASQFDLALTVAEIEGGWDGYLEYSVELFAAASMERFVSHFRRVLEAWVADPSQRLASVDLVDAATRRELLRWGTGAQLVGEQAAKLPSPAQTSLTELVRTAARDHGDAPALVCEQRQLSHAELDSAVEAAAAVLAAQGVGDASIVALALPRSIEQVVGLLAILRCGGAWLAIEASDPPARRARILAEAGHPPVLGTADLELPEACRRLSLDAAASEGEAVSEAPQRGDASALAYLVYTSGSSGAPKGVMVEHGAAVNHMQWMAEAFPLGPGRRLLAKTPLIFDAAIWELFVPLMTGACVVLAAPDAHRDSGVLAEQLRAHQITDLQLVPSQLALLLDDPGFAAGAAKLRRITCGGEALATGLMQRLLDSCEAELVNLYGPAEATIDACAWRAVDGFDGPTAPIGTPIANLSCRVLEGDQLAAVGVPGELCLGGAGLARGYLGRPDLDAARFVPSPLAEDGGARLYRTGDRVRWLASGELEFLGRLDDQVKLRGVRIELGEIEAALAEHPAVREAAALVLGSGERAQLAAWIVGDESSERSALLSHLRDRLPRSHIPTQLAWIDTLPRTGSGKLDRRALPRFELSDGSAEGVITGPRDVAETLLAELWSDVLDRPADSLDIHANFFDELGGHSLLAARLITRIRDLLAIELPIEQLFAAPTLAEFAEALAERLGGRPALLEQAELVADVLTLPDAEVERLLALADPHGASHAAPSARSTTP